MRQIDQHKHDLAERIARLSPDQLQQLIWELQKNITTSPKEETPCAK